jgi:hypothetical protein
MVEPIKMLQGGWRSVRVKIYDRSKKGFTVTSYDIEKINKIKLTY